MEGEIKSEQEKIEGALVAADMAWWSLEFPSGALKFSRNKTDMLGYDMKDFTHYMHFTELIHPDDYDRAMDAMRDHYEGRKPMYITTYRIKNKNGDYVTFFDQGKIVERLDGAFTVAGIVSKIDPNAN